MQVGGISHSYNLPAGVLFVLRSESTEKDYIDANQMDSVYFDKHPEQLVAVVSTSENIDALKTFLSQANLDSNLALTFEQFLTKEIEKSNLTEKDTKPKREVLTEEMKEKMRAEEQSKYIDQDAILSQSQKSDELFSDINLNRNKQIAR